MPIIILLGFIFRLLGISNNHSFWPDEAYVTSTAKLLVKGTVSTQRIFNSFGIWYQNLQVVNTAFFLKFFGFSEFAARLPSVIYGTVGIIFTYLLAKKLSNHLGGLLAAFLYTFSHLNLSYATQAKQYAAIQTLTLMIFYLVYKLSEAKKSKFIVLNLLIIFCITLATGLHFLGMLTAIPYVVYYGLKLRPKNVKAAKFSLVFLTAIIIVAGYWLVSSGWFRHNHSYQVLKLFGYHYFFITIFSIGGFMLSFSRNINLSFSLIIYALALFTLVTFKQYIFNIRYVLSAFGILFVYFGVFFGIVGERLFPKRAWLLPLVASLLLFFAGYKISRLPQVYYNPNIDKYGDVQIANHKKLYQKIKTKFKNPNSLFVINDAADSEAWYFARYSDIYFSRFVKKGFVPNAINGRPEYGQLKDFKKQITKHPKGIIIIEDWHSFLPDDIKTYAKKNLKLETRVESLDVAKNDPWPLEVRSWGMTNKDYAKN